MGEIIYMITKSKYGLNETLGRLLKVLVEHDMTIFSIIDHSGGAAQIDIKMPNTKLIIFGNPKGGTNIMLADPNIAIELPLKILLREDNGITLIIYHKLIDIAENYEVDDILESIKKLDESIENLIKLII
jgi:uncharacterized protein (DUF302 family)